MKNNRRNFLKLSGITGISFAGGGIIKAFAKTPQDKNIIKYLSKPHKQHFNMSGYAAPTLDTVRVGFIGLGNREPAHLRDMTKLEGGRDKSGM